jgi:hypothetical protein
MFAVLLHALPFLLRFSYNSCFCKVRDVFYLFAGDNEFMTWDDLIQCLEFGTYDTPSIDTDLVKQFFQTPLTCENFLGSLMNFGDHLAEDYESENFETGEQFVTEMVYKIEANFEEKVNCVQTDLNFLFFFNRKTFRSLKEV